MRAILLCALMLTGCSAPRQAYTTEAVAEQKQNALARRDKEKARNNEALRLAVRQVYLQDHPELSADIRKAILKEQIKVGMTPWHVIAAYSLWEYTTYPSVAKYQEFGALPLWTLADRSQTSSKEQWILMREKETRYLFFENGLLTKWKD